MRIAREKIYQGKINSPPKIKREEGNRVILAAKSHGPKGGRGWCTLHTRNNSLIFILSCSSQRNGGHRVLIHRTKICSLSGVYSRRPLMNSLEVIDATTSLHHSQLGLVIKLSPLRCVSMCFLNDSKLMCRR